MAKATAAAPEVSEAPQIAEPVAPQVGLPASNEPLTPAAVLFLQRHAGNAAIGRLLRHGAPQKHLLQRLRYDVGAPGSRSGMDVGDTGPGVELLQKLLGAQITATFDAQTRKAVDEFQREQGWQPSGVGADTWARIDGHEGSPGNRPNLKRGSRGPGVALLQRILGVTQSYHFGAATRAAVDDFQRLQGWAPSGVGPQTWARLDAKLVADQMGQMADPAHPTEAKWHGSGPGTHPGEPGMLPSGYATNFAEWASAASETTFTVGPSTVINCWEMVLYAAYRAGDLTWKWIHDIYSYTGGSWSNEMVNRLTPKGRTSFDRTTQSPKPRRGDIVLFDGISHVALATGVGTETYTFWPPPNVTVTTAWAGKWYVVATPDKVKKYPIEDLAKACDHPATGHVCTVECGAPPWG